MLFGDKELIFDKPLIMGIINLTPDSFSDGGKFFFKKNSKTILDIEKVSFELDQLQKDGASFIDIGAESTRPGHTKISPKEEIDRLMPVLELISESNCVISIDSRKPEIIREVLNYPIGLINDVSSLDSIESKELIRDHNIPVCVMHNTRNKLISIEDDIHNFFNKKINELTSFGIPKKNIILDPGFGYDKSFEDNKKLLFEVDYSRYENKLLIGLSRKGFLNKIFQKSELKDLDEKSTFASIIASERGANILRIHNVSMLFSKINESK
tara:strand:- start:125 stop:931 length:807 start_codon:yes stop_codon:yes gene_type:complete